MKYTITFMKKNGKIKGKVGCNSEKTAQYLVNTWLEDKDKKGVCLVINNETKKEHVWKK